MKLLFFWVGLVFSMAMVARGEPGSAPVSAEEVLGRALEVRGGKNAFSNLRSFHAKGTVLFYTRSGPWWDAPSITNVWPLEILATRTSRFRCVTDLSSTAGASTVFVPPRYYENGFDGQTAWEAPPGNPPRTLPGILGAERREQAECFAWCAEAQNYRSVTNLGETGFEGHRCHQLRLVRQSGNEETHYYDVTNHFLAGIVRSSVFGPSLERFVFDNYREFGGFQFPTRIAYRAENEGSETHLSAVEQFNSIEVNCVQESAFTMPSESARLDSPGQVFAPEITRAEHKRHAAGLDGHRQRGDRRGGGIAG